eukprot:symbB.v1.2.006529.t1/scaffold389.1/size214891/4
MPRSSSRSRPRRVRSRNSSRGRSRDGDRRRDSRDRYSPPPRARESRRRPSPRRPSPRRPSPKAKSVSKSRSRSPKEVRRDRPPVVPGGGIESVEAKVVDARTRHSGEQTYQAEIYLGLDAASAGRQRTMCVRGPCRVDKSQAQEDADKMEDATRDGIKAVREIAATIKRSRISTTPA